MIRMPRIVTSLHWRAAPTVRATRPRRLHSGHRHPFLNGLTPKRSSLPYSANWNHVTFISFSCNNLQSSFELRMSLLPPVVDPINWERRLMFFQLNSKTNSLGKSGLSRFFSSLHDLSSNL